MNAKPGEMLQCIVTNKPFERMGMDLLGPFPASYTGNRQIIVAIDYLTKWAEARALPTGEAKDVAGFVVDNILLRYGAPTQIIMD